MSLENKIRDQISLIVCAYNSSTKFINISTEQIMEIIKQEKEPDEKKLRYWLWLKHGHPESLYGDDGEMQCSECILDFKRDSIEKINRIFERQAIRIDIEKGDFISAIESILPAFRIKEPKENED